MHTLLCFVWVESTELDQTHDLERLNEEDTYKTLTQVRIISKEQCHNIPGSQARRSSDWILVTRHICSTLSSWSKMRNSSGPESRDGSLCFSSMALELWTVVETWEFRWNALSGPRHPSQSCSHLLFFSHPPSWCCILNYFVEVAKITITNWLINV